MKKKLIALIAVLSIIFFLSIIGKQTSKFIRPLEARVSFNSMIADLTTIWYTSRHSYAYRDELGSDWDELFISCLEESFACHNNYDYQMILHRMTAGLKDGHSYAVLPSNIIKGTHYLPVKINYFNQKYVVTATNEAYTEIEPGSIITHIDEIEIDMFLEENFGTFIGIQTPNAREQMLLTCLETSSRNDVLRMRLVGSSNISQDISLAYLPPPVKYTNYNFTGLDLKGEDAGYEYLTVNTMEDDIFYVHIKSFLSEQVVTEFKDYIDKTLPLARAYILDIRNNGGGNGSYGTEILSFFEEPANLAPLSTYKPLTEPDINLEEIKTQIAQFEQEADCQITEMFEKTIAELNAAGEPEFVETETTIHEVLAQTISDLPVVILINSYAGSAADDFAAQCKTERFVVIGTNTRGATGWLINIDLKSSAVFGLTGLMTFDGKMNHIRNRGVQPDIWVDQTVNDYMNHCDTILSAAVNYLKPILKK